jgi:sugar/nucleoside kinase (ribokinase family)
MTQQPDYLIIGHVTADLTPEQRQIGGTVTYAAPVAHSFGLPVKVVTSTAPGEPLLEELLPYLDDVVVVPAQKTSTFENIYTPQGRVQYIRGVAASLTAADIPEAWLTASLVHLAPLTDEVAPDVAALFPDATVLLTLQGWLRTWGDDGRVHFKRWFDRDVLKHIDIVVFSEEDIREAPELEHLFAEAVPHLFVTRAAQGGSYYRDGQRFEYITPQVDELIPTGAGDVFAAALLCSLHRVNGDMHAAAQVAATLAAYSITRAGLDSAPTEAEIQQALAEVVDDSG